MTIEDSVKAAEQGYITTIGYTPSSSNDFDPKMMRDIIQKHNFVAVRAGLDYSKLETCPKNLQKDVLIEQIAIAKENNLPAYLSYFDSFPDFLLIL